MWKSSISAKVGNLIFPDIASFPGFHVKALFPFLDSFTTFQIRGIAISSEVKSLNPFRRAPLHSCMRFRRDRRRRRMTTAAGDGRDSAKWAVLVASIWVQAFTGTNFDFSSYSSDLKSALGISQVQLNYLSTASDMGKAFGWCSGALLKFFPIWVVFTAAAFMGFFGYGIQWLVVQGKLSLPYFLVFLLSLLAGCSISWFNTVCYVLCIKSFPGSRSLALSLSISFNGVSAAIYNLIANAINSSDSTLFLLLNAVIPLVISAIVFLLILQKPSPHALHGDAVHRDSKCFFCLYILAAFTGVYLLVLNASHSSQSVPKGAVFVGAIVLLIAPLITTGVVLVRDRVPRTSYSSIRTEESSSIDVATLDIEKTLVVPESGYSYDPKVKESCCDVFLLKDSLEVLGEEHSAWALIARLEFWLYYLAYLGCGTLGIVYINNLGQIAQSLGYDSGTSSLVSLYSSSSFFGRLLSAAPDFLRDKAYYPRTGWLALSLVPTPTAFLLLVLSGSKMALGTATALIGLSSGFMFTVAVSITAELFGPNSAGINHNVLITNIPLGSLFYGLLAALLYEANIGSSNHLVFNDGRMVCLGRNCYAETFVWWSCISFFGVAAGFLLFLRTRAAYARNKHWM